MRESIFKKTSDVVLASILLWFASSLQSLVARAPDPPPGRSFGIEVSPSRYLEFYNTFRNAGLIRVNTLSNYRIAQQTAKLDEELFQMDSELYRRDALSQDDFYRSNLHRNLSAAREHQLGQRAAILESTRKLNLLQAEMIRGGAVDIKKLYDSYVEQWDGECLLFKKNIEAAQAQFAWDNYVLNVDKNLLSQGYIPRSEYMQHQRDLYAAQDDLATQQFLDRICLDKIPTFDEVKKIAPAS